MIALRKIKPGPGLDLLEVPAPSLPNEGEVLLRVRATGICGTDLHIDEWTPSYHFVGEALPVTVGHEFCGEVHRLGSGVTDLMIGQKVAVRPSVVCGRCDICKSGCPDLCVNRQGIGVVRDGGFTGFVAVPARNCVLAPQDLDPELIALTEPLTVSFEAVRTGGVKPDARVLVLGPGNIGQGIALFARAAGAGSVVIAGHGDHHRLAVLRDMGFRDVLDLATDHGMGQLFDIADQRGFDVVIEATGSTQALDLAMKVLAVRGVLVVAGIHTGQFSINPTALVRKQQQIRGAYRAREADWPTVLEFIRTNTESVRRMVTHRLSLEAVHDGFDLCRQRVATKVMVIQSPAQHE